MSYSIFEKSRQYPMDISRARSPMRSLGSEIHLPERITSPGLGRRHATKRQTAEPARLSIMKTQEIQRAKSLLPQTLQGESLLSLTGSETLRLQTLTDWLPAAERNLEQDLETTKRELELIQYMIEDVKERIRTEKNISKRSQDKEILITACREYTDYMTRYRKQARKDRLRQVKFWISSREMGRKVPIREPVDWLAVDVEWRRWLSEQAAARGATSLIEELADTTWRIMGSLPYIVFVYSWLEEAKMR